MTRSQPLKHHLTHLNHFEYGRIQGHSSVFFSKISLPNRDVKTARDEAKNAALKVYESAQGLPLNLCISGGIDSEVMLWSFLDAKVPFRATIMRFADGLNEFDIFNAIEFCKQHQIELRVLDLDAISFLESGRHLEYAQKYGCQSPQLAIHLWMIDQVEGFPVLSGNFVFPEITDAGVFYLGLPGDLHATYFRYFEVTGRAGVPWFLIYTPELVRAFLDTPLLAAQFTAAPSDRQHFTYAVKCEAYRQGGFDVAARPDKFTGFEKIRQIYDEKFGTNHGTKFDELFRHPMVQMNPLPEEFLQIIDGAIEAPSDTV